MKSVVHSLEYLVPFVSFVVKKLVLIRVYSWFVVFFGFSWLKKSVLICEICGQV